MNKIEIINLGFGGGGGVEATNLATSIGYDLPNIVFCQI